MNNQQAVFAARKLAKQNVRDYFKREGAENFNWEAFGSKIIKKELFHAFKLFQPHFNPETGKWCVMFMHGNKIVAQ
jgi:hypothetical protein